MENFHTVGKGINLNSHQLLISKAGQEFVVTPSITCKFDGKFLRVYYKGIEHTKPCEAKIGDVFWVYPSGKSKTPRLKKDKAQSRGHKIARLMSFGSEKQYSFSEAEFLIYAHELSKEKNISNIKIEYKKGVYGFIIADVLHPSSKVEETKLKENSPLKAWIADTINTQNLEELLEIFSKYKSLCTPAEFFLIL